MQQVYQLFRKLLLFFLVASILYVLLVCVWGTFLSTRYAKNVDVSLTNSYLRFQDAKSTEAVDLVFTGSSHAYRGFDTRIFKKAGFTSFNLGSSSQTPIQSELLLRRYVGNLQPKMVVLEVYPNTFTMDGVESSLDILSNNPDIDYFGLTSKHRHVRVLNTAIFSMFRKYVIGFPAAASIKLPKQDNYVDGGYVERKISHYKPRSTNKPLSLDYNESQFINLERTIAFLESQDIKVIMVTAPIAPTVYNRYTNLDVFDKRMLEYGDYFNFNERLKLDDSLHFFDSHHLNQHGVIEFNRDLINLLNEKQYLK